MVHDVAVEQPVAFALRRPFHRQRAASRQHLRHHTASRAAGNGCIALPIAHALHREIEPVEVHADVSVN